MDTKQRTDGDVSMETLVSENKLAYTLPRNLNVTNQRRIIKIPSTVNTYTQNQTISIVFNSSDDYLDTKNGYLQFSLTAGTGTTFGTGSAGNLFNSSTITHSSGREADRLNNVGDYINNYIKYNMDADEQATIGRACGYGVGAIVGTVLNYSIPLHMLHPFFGGDMSGKLMPSFLASGLRWELSLNSDAHSFLDADGSPVVSLTNVAVIVPSITLKDSVVAELSAESAKHGTEWLFKSIHSVEQNIGTNTSATFRVEKGVSRAIKAYVIPMLNTAYGAVTVDRFLREPAFNITSYQYNLGSLYLPNHTITTALESYMTAMNVMSEYKSKKPYVAPADFSATSLQLLATSLERSDTVALSGFSVSGTRALVLNVTFDTPVSRNLLCMLEHYKVCRSYLYDKIVVEA